MQREKPLWRTQKPAFYWRKEKCRATASEFKTRTEFQDGSPSAYNRALNDGFLDEICQHMRPAGSKFRRALYAYEFVDKSVYVGLTFDYTQRHHQHLTDTRKKLLGIRRGSDACINAR
jgi:hypothetical protein